MPRELCPVGYEWDDKSQKCKRKKKSLKRRFVENAVKQELGHLSKHIMNARYYR